MKDIEERRQQIQATILSEEEIIDPTKVILLMYETSTCIDYLKVDIWEFLKAAFSDMPYAYRNEPAKAYEMHNTLNKLLEALWLLLKIYEFENGEVEIPVPTAKEERSWMMSVRSIQDAYCGRIKRLNQLQVANPFMAVKAAFEFHDLAEWRSSLHKLTDAALSNYSIVEEEECTMVFREFEYLEMMMEVGHLLYVQSSGPDKSEIVPATNENSKKTGKEVYEVFIEFLEYVPAARLNRNLRKVLLDLVGCFSEGLPNYFDDFVCDLGPLTLLLDAIERKPQNWFGKEEDK